MLSVTWLPWIGQLRLRNLKLKKGTLDKFQLPVDISEGRFVPYSSVTLIAEEEAPRSSMEIYIVPSLDELGKSTRRNISWRCLSSYYYRAPRAYRNLRVTCDHLWVACSQMTADDMLFRRRDRRSRKCHADLYRGRSITQILILWYAN